MPIEKFVNERKCDKAVIPKSEGFGLVKGK
jgi:hypothetical protein